MKKLFLILAILATMASCDSKSGQRAATIKPKSTPAPKPLKNSDVIALIDAGKGRSASSTAIVDVVVLKLSTYPDSVIYKYSYDYSGQYVFVDFK